MILASMQFAIQIVMRYLWRWEEKECINYGICMYSTEAYHIFSLLANILKIRFPVCQSRSECHILWSAVEPVHCTQDLYDSCLGIAYLYLTSEYCQTVCLESIRASRRRYACLGIESTAIQSYLIETLISARYRRKSWCSPREYPYAITNKYRIWSWSYNSRICRIGEECRISNTRWLIVFHFPAVGLITWESEPVRITDIYHPFYPFPSDIYGFYIVLCVTCVVHSSADRLKQCSDPKSHDREYCHEFDHGSTFFWYEHGSKRHEKYIMRSVVFPLFSRDTRSLRFFYDGKDLIG